MYSDLKVCALQSNKLVILANSQEECEKAFEILFKVIRKSTLPISKDFCIQSDEFQSLVSRLQRGALVQIEVLQDCEEDLVKIIGIEEDLSKVAKEIGDFIKNGGIRSVAYRPQVPHHVWSFLAKRVNHEIVKQIAEDLKQYSISIQITDDQEHYLVRGFNTGIEQCKQRLSELASMIAEQEKKFEYPGVKQLFLDQSGKEQLIMIGREMDVEIELVSSRRRYSKMPVPLPRKFSLPTKKAETFIYDVCNFSTNEGINVSWKYGSIENEVVSNASIESVMVYLHIVAFINIDFLQYVPSAGSR